MLIILFRITQIHCYQIHCCCCSVTHVSHSVTPWTAAHHVPCPSLSPGVCWNTCPLSWWCHPAISLSVASFSSCPQSFPASGFFPELVLHIRRPKYWSFSFSISPSNEYSGLISFKIDWFDLLLTSAKATRFMARVEVAQSCATHGLYPNELLCSWNFLGKSTGVGCHFLLQGIFLTRESSPGLLHCRQTLYPLNHHRFMATRWLL